MITSFQQLHHNNAKMPKIIKNQPQLPPPTLLPYRWLILDKVVITFRDFMANVFSLCFFFSRYLHQKFQFKRDVIDRLRFDRLQSSQLLRIFIWLFSTYAAYYWAFGTAFYSSQLLYFYCWRCRIYLLLCFLRILFLMISFSLLVSSLALISSSIYTQFLGCLGNCFTHGNDNLRILSIQFMEDECLSLLFAAGSYSRVVWGY